MDRISDHHLTEMAESEAEDIVKLMQELSIAKTKGDRAWEGKAYYKLSRAFYSQDDFKQAIEYLKLHLSISKEVGDRCEEGRASCFLGVVYHRQGDFQQAIECHKLHLSIAKELRNRACEASACFYLGIVYDSLHNFEQAIEYYKQCVSIAKEEGDRTQEGEACHRLAEAYESQGSFEQAIEYCKQWLCIAKEVGDSVKEGKAYCHLGGTYHRLGDFQQAIECHKLHLSIAKELGDRDGECRACFNLGVVYNSLLNFKQAIEYCKQCVSICKEIGNRTSEGDAYCNLGDAYHSLGNFKQAIVYYKQHLSIAEDLGDRAEEKMAYRNLGNAYTGLGNFKQAKDFYKLSVRSAKELGDRPFEGNVYGNLGSLYDRLGNYKQAIEYHKLSLRIAKELGDRVWEGRAYGNLGTTYNRLSNLEQGIKYLKQGLSISKEVGNRISVGHISTDLGNAYSALNDFEQATEYIKQGLSIAKEVGNREDERLAYKSLGTVYYSLGNLKEAIKYYKQHLNIAKEVGDKPAEACACHSLGCVYKQSGSFNEALNYYRSSVKIFDDTRALLQSEDAMKISFCDKYARAYTALWSLLVDNEATDEALCVAEKGRAQALTDVLKIEYDVNSVSSVSVEPKGYISNLLNNSATQIVFVGLDDHNISFWLLRKGKEIIFKQKKIECDSSKLLVEATLRDIGAGVRVKCENRSMEKLRDDPPSNSEAAEETEQSPTSSVNSLRRLYDVIIGPIADFLQGDQLIVVPDGPFCLAPYSALSESIRIRTVPSLTALHLIAGAPEDFHSRSGALLVGDPCLEEVTNLVGERFWKQLPFARKEVEMIGKLLNTTPLIGKDATKGEVLQRLKSVALVHIAAHGCAETGEILLAPNPGWTSRIPGKEHYILRMSDVQAVHLRARLVVLSCCHSGRGEVKSEGVVGIARAFLCAGARSVLVSLWAINDEATMEFMKHFYQHLADGKSASVALHQAMKSLREAEQFHALKYWAPFVLIGDDVTLEFGEKK